MANPPAMQRQSSWGDMMEDPAQAGETIYLTDSPVVCTPGLSANQAKLAQRKDSFKLVETASTSQRNKRSNGKNRRSGKGGSGRGGRGSGGRDRKHGGKHGGSGSRRRHSDGRGGHGRDDERGSNSQTNSGGSQDVRSHTPRKSKSRNYSPPGERSTGIRDGKGSGSYRGRGSGSDRSSRAPPRRRDWQAPRTQRNTPPRGGGGSTTSSYFQSFDPHATQHREPRPQQQQQQQQWQGHANFQAHEPEIHGDMMYAGPYTGAPQQQPYMSVLERERMAVQMLQDQFEFYFGDNNLVKDMYIRGQMDRKGYVPLRVLGEFYRIRCITNSPDLLLQAGRNSKHLKVKRGAIRKRDKWYLWTLPPQLEVADEDESSESEPEPETLAEAKARREAEAELDRIQEARRAQEEALKEEARACVAAALAEKTQALEIA